MKDRTQQYKDHQAQTNTVRTYVRQGWIPTVAQIPIRENRNYQMERQAVPHHRSRSSYPKRQQSWVAWPQL